MPIEPENKRKVIECIHKLWSSDEILFTEHCHERTITHKLAQYLQESFNGWDIDVEYNRKVSTDGMPFVVKMFNGTPIFPDIIIHHRGTRENLIVIEMKMKGSMKKDRIKLEGLTLHSGGYGYECGLLIKFNSPGKCKMHWYANGVLVESEPLSMRIT